MPVVTLRSAFEQFLEGSSFARRTRESYTEDLAPLFAACGQAPIPALAVEAANISREPRSACTCHLQSALGRTAQFYPVAPHSGVADRGSPGEGGAKTGRETDSPALDAQRVESVLRQIADPRNRALFWLIYDGGLCCQEALAIDIEDISWQDRSILIHGKGDRPREMFFSRAVGTLLDKYLTVRGGPSSSPRRPGA